MDMRICSCDDCLTIHLSIRTQDNNLFTHTIRRKEQFLEIYVFVTGGKNFDVYILNIIIRNKPTYSTSSCKCLKKKN